MAKKEKNCDPTDPADDRKGDTWDYVALDPEHRLVVSVVPGERTAENAAAVVEDFGSSAESVGAFWLREVAEIVQ